MIFYKLPRLCRTPATPASVRFSVESGDKKKEGVSEQLCLAGQKGDTPCHLKPED